MRIRAGFSLIEVLVALFILSTAIFVLSELQVRSMLRVWDGREDIDRLYELKKHALHALWSPEKVKARSREVEQPEMQLIQTSEDISKKSSLASFAKQLRLFKTSGNWERGSSKRSLSMLALLPRTNQEGA